MNLDWWVDFVFVLSFAVLMASALVTPPFLSGMAAGGVGIVLVIAVSFMLEEMGVL